MSKPPESPESDDRVDAVVEGRPYPDAFLRRAADRLPGAEWIPMPTAILRRDPAWRLLDPRTYVVAIDALLAQWQLGSVPASPRELAKYLGCTAKAAAAILERFEVDPDNRRQAREPRLHRQREESLHRFALTMWKGSRGGTAKAEGLAQLEAQLQAQPLAQDRTGQDRVVVVPPPDGWTERGRAVQAAAVRAVQAGLVVTPLTMGTKVPPSGKRQAWFRSVGELSSWPGDPCNLGYQPGASGFLEVDIDSPTGEAIAVELGAFAEPTLAVQTPRSTLPPDHPKAFPGAVRLRFVMPPDLTFGKVKLRDTLEVFGNTGYVLLPPSWIGEYGAGYTVVQDFDPLPCPPRLITAIREATTTRPKPVEGPSGQAAPFLEALERVTGQRTDLRRRQQHTVQCPAHDDVKPSLRVKVYPDGGLHFYCHGGCSAVDVLSALGLTWADFYHQEAA